MDETNTLSSNDRPEDLLGSVAEPAAHLFVILDGGSPIDGGSRHLLHGRSEVTIGRGDRRGHSVDGDRLALRFSDRRISGDHARLTREAGIWWIEDRGSKNGTRVDGRPLQGRLPLADGAFIEVGAILMRFRAALPTVAAVSPDADTRTDGVPAAGLETLLPGLAAEFAKLARYAATPGTLVILGETGTGKDVTARAYHALSGRGGAFVAVNCGALPETLLESLLFGHKRGAFSGANADAVGLVRSADGGTLFLDELGDMPLPSQAALLRVIESQEVLPVGAQSPVRVDVRYVAATHRDIPAMIGRGEFRADLWARLCGHVLYLPPLRARREDLGLLLAATLRRLAPDRAANISMQREAARALLRRRFPLNVRELSNTIARALALSDGDVLLAEHLEDPALAPAATTPYDELPSGRGGAAGARQPSPGPEQLAPAAAAEQELSPRERRRRAQLEILLEEHGGNVSEVARALRKARPLVYKWLKALGLDPEKYRR